MENIDEAYDYSNKWVPKISIHDKQELMKFLNSKETTYGRFFIIKYIEYIEKYTDVFFLLENDKINEPDYLASGIIFFYGCLFYIMHFKDWGQYIEDIFLYNLLYILVDHYIDNIKIDDDTKEKAISQMHILINNPELHSELPLLNPILKKIAIIYKQLIDRCPRSSHSLKNLFYAEIEGLYIQKTHHHNRDTYYNIALKKGGYTMLVLYDIVGCNDINIKNSTYHMGTIMQLIDDSADVLSDIKNGINTIATHDLSNFKLLDTLFFDILNRIKNINSYFNIFRILYIIFTVYLPDRLPLNYTSFLRYKFNTLNLFDYNYGCDGALLLSDAVFSEIIIRDYRASLN